MLYNSLSRSMGELLLVAAGQTSLTQPQLQVNSLLYLLDHSTIVLSSAQSGSSCLAPVRYSPYPAPAAPSLPPHPLLSAFPALHFPTLLPAKAPVNKNAKSDIVLG